MSQDSFSDFGFCHRFSKVEQTSTTYSYRDSDFSYDFKGKTTRIGVGRHGEVHRAKMGEKEVALKIFQKTEVANSSNSSSNNGGVEYSSNGSSAQHDFGQIWNDENATTSCVHPHIVATIGIVNHSDESKALVMELMNCDLKAYLRQNPRLSLFDCLRLMRDTALGVDYLHSLPHPIVHNNLKPENCLLSSSGVLKIGDANFPWSNLFQPQPPTVSDVRSHFYFTCCGDTSF